MARSRDLGKLPFELKGGAVKTILSKATNDDYDFVFRNLEAADMPTGIDALNISTGKVTNTEFDYLDGATSNIQGQIDAIKGIKHATASGTDTYTATITGVTSYADGDAYLIRFTNGNTTGCTLNINSLGAKALYRNNDGSLIGGDIVDGGEMLCVYNSTLNGFQAIGTAPNTLLAYVTNADSVAITKGMPVYAFGGTGDRMTVKRAYNTGDATSAKTVGLVLSSSISANQKGLIIIQGLLDGLNILPTSTFADGDTIYLGSTAGSITNEKPYAPNHLVYLGVVTTASNGNAGRMYVRVQNGYELDELHNVQAQTPSTNDVLYYFGGNQWKTASISSVLGYTPGTVSSVAALTLGTSGTDLSSTVANGTTTPVITLNVPTASASNRGVLSSADWSTFNSKESALTFSTGLSRVGNTITNTITQYTDALARLAITDSVTGLDYNSTTGVWSTTTGYGIPTTASQTNWDTAYTNRITSLTTTGNSGSATLVSNTLNIPTYTLSGLGGQPLATNLTSLAGLTYASASFVKMTAAGTFSLDTATYLTTNTLLTGLSGGQTVIGGTAASNNLTLSSTSNATKGKVIFGTLSAYNETNDRLGIGTTSPSYGLHIVKSSGTSLFIDSTASGSTAFQANGTTTVTSGITPHALIQLTSSPVTNSSAGSRSLYMRHNLNASTINFTGSAQNGPTSAWFENRIINAGTITSILGSFTSGLLMGGDVVSCGTVTDAVGIRAIGLNSFSNSVTNTVTNSRAFYAHNAVKNTSTLTNQVGLNVEALSAATNNTAILLGTTTIPSGNFAIYSASTETSYFAGSIQIADKDLIFGTGAGTKIGTVTSQKLAFWNKTPIVQPTTSLTVSLTFTANTGTAVNDASTFGGYTLKQIAQALINIGILA